MKMKQPDSMDGAQTQFLGAAVYPTASILNNYVSQYLLLANSLGLCIEGH